MHETGKIVHRDLKLDNCFVDKCMIVKIGDFGTCKLIDEESTMLKSKVGTDIYMAPEIFSSQPYEGPPVDIYSLGVILFTLLNAQFPYTRAGDKNHVRFLSNPVEILKKRGLKMEDEAISLL